MCLFNGMPPNDDLHLPGEPDGEDIEDIMDFLNKEEKFREVKKNARNRLFHDYSSESHWEGWLKIHGIKWS